MAIFECNDAKGAWALALHGSQAADDIALGEERLDSFGAVFAEIESLQGTCGDKVESWDEVALAKSIVAFGEVERCRVLREEFWESHGVPILGGFLTKVKVSRVSFG